MIFPKSIFRNACKLHQAMDEGVAQRTESKVPLEPKLHLQEFAFTSRKLHLSVDPLGSLFPPPEGITPITFMFSINGEPVDPQPIV